MKDEWYFALVGPETPHTHQAKLREYDPNEDDIRSIFHDICGVLANLGVRFIVISSSGERWPVDTATDLPIFLKQLPSLLRFLDGEGDSAFELDFYEQGIERRLELTRSRSSLDIECVPYGNSASPRAKSSGDVLFWKAMLRRFYSDFLKAASDACPSVMEHPWMHEWCAVAF